MGHIIISLGLEALNTDETGAGGRERASEAIEVASKRSDDGLGIPLPPSLAEALWKDKELTRRVTGFCGKVLAIEDLIFIFVEGDVEDTVTSEELMRTGEVLEDR